jgi:hypothetical protein
MHPLRDSTHCAWAILASRNPGLGNHRKEVLPCRGRSGDHSVPRTGVLAPSSRIWKRSGVDATP